MTISIPLLNTRSIGSAALLERANAIDFGDAMPRGLSNPCSAVHFMAYPPLRQTGADLIVQCGFKGDVTKRRAQN